MMVQVYNMRSGEYSLTDLQCTSENALWCLYWEGCIDIIIENPEVLDVFENLGEYLLFNLPFVLT